ncbi:V-type ATP synthase subunit I [Candidatus Woesearchaeota archaeon]|nr:V-type ATP synthase subunit I [Candidatus Woesearchaeota archaeon]
MVLKPESMGKITLVGPKSYREAVVAELHRLKILHISDHAKTDDIDVGSPLEKANELSEVLVKIRSISSWLRVKRKNNSEELKIEAGYDLGALSKKLYLEVKQKIEQLREVEGRVSANNSLKAELEALKNIAIDLSAFAEYRSIAYFAGYVKNLDGIENRLRAITEKFELYAAAEKGKNVIVLFVEIEKKNEAREILIQHGLSDISTQNLRGMRGRAHDSIRALEEEKSSLLKQMEKVTGSMGKLRLRYEKHLLFAEDFLEKELEKAEAPLRFAETKNTFVINGWVPEKDAEDAMKKLNAAGKNKIFFNLEEPGKKDSVPVKLKNPGPVRPFEFFMDLYTMPTYRELDPTFLVFLTFPLLFGFMLGDFGYGLVTLVLFIALKKKMPKAKNFFNILIFASIATIFFGLLFGEFFGFEEIGHFKLPHIISRSHQVTELLYLAVAVGVIHINIGLIAGFYNELKSHGFMAALYAKGGWIVLQIGVALLALSYLKIIALPIYTGIIFFVLSLLMLLKGEGIRGLIELPGIFSNILSYARLMAIGLSSVKLAEVINESATEMFHGGGFLILTGILLLLVGHIVNIGLGLLGSFLHSLRLHYVEFFTKFFHGGAKKFKPFGAKS